MNKQTLLKSLSTTLDSRQGIDQFKILILKLASNGLLLDEIDAVDDLYLAKQSKSKKPGVKADIRIFRNSKDQALSSMRIADIVEVVPQSLSKIKSSAIQKNGKYPVVDQGKAFVSGFSDAVEAIEASQNPVIVFGDHTRNIKYVDFDFVVGADGVKILRPYSLNPKYFFYMAQALGIESRGYGRHFREFCSSYIPIMSIKDQLRTVKIVEEILAVCGMLEEGISKRNALLDSARKSTVDAVSTAQTPEELQIAWQRTQNNWEVVAGTPEGIESLRGLILDILFKPKKIDDWKIRSFGDLLTISNGDRSKNYPSKEYRVSTGIPFVNAGHLKDGQIDLSEMDYISREKYESLSGGKFQDGDILFCLRGSLGKSALVKNFGEGAIASSLAILKVGDEIDSEYLFWFLQSGMARIQVKKFDNGTAQPNLAAKSVLRFQIPLPKLAEQKSIVLKVTELMKICDQLEQKMIQIENVSHKLARSVVSASA